MVKAPILRFGGIFLSRVTQYDLIGTLENADDDSSHLHVVRDIMSELIKVVAKWPEADLNGNYESSLLILRRCWCSLQWMRKASKFWTPGLFLISKDYFIWDVKCKTDKVDQQRLVRFICLTYHASNRLVSRNEKQTLTWKICMSVSKLLISNDWSGLQIKIPKVNILVYNDSLSRVNAFEWQFLGILKMSAKNVENLRSSPFII